MALASKDETMYSQRKEVDIIIDFPISKSLDNLEYVLDGYQFLYAFAIHDKDVYTIDDKKKIPEGKKIGDLKTKHIHLDISAKKRHQLKYYLRIVTEALGVNFNQVSITGTDSFAGRVQYLIHKHKPNKYQYDPSIIKTNMSEGQLSDLLEEDTSITFSTSDIINIIRESNGSRLYIIEKIGIARYTMYRNTINDIYTSLCALDDKYNY